MYPAIMRTSTLDPLAEKYYSISTYAWCGGNPVKFVDPDGRTIWIALASTSEEKPTMVQYKNGKLYNQNGSLYKGRDEFAIKTKNVLNNLFGLKDKFITKVINTLIESKNPHTIQLDKSSEGNRSDSSPQGNNYVASEKRESIGSYIVVNFKQNPLEDGLKNNEETELGHELRHSYDYDQGKNKGQDTFDKRNQTAKDPKEIRAVGFENRVRRLMKLEQRKKYGSNNIKPYNKEE